MPRVIAPLPLLGQVLFLGLTAGCSGPTEVSATPPTVSYRVTGNDVAQAGVEAQRYCSGYAKSAQFQGFERTDTGNLAVYSCN